MGGHETGGRGWSKTRGPVPPLWLGPKTATAAKPKSYKAEAQHKNAKSKTQAK